MFLRFHSPFHRSFLLFVVACRFLRRFALPRPCRIFRFSPIDLNSPPISVQFLYCTFFRLIASYSVPSWQVSCRVHTYTQTYKQKDAPFAFSESGIVFFASLLIFLLFLNSLVTFSSQPRKMWTFCPFLHVAQVKHVPVLFHADGNCLSVDPDDTGYSGLPDAETARLSRVVSRHFVLRLKMEKQKGKSLQKQRVSHMWNKMTEV